MKTMMLITAGSALLAGCAPTYAPAPMAATHGADAAAQTRACFRTMEIQNQRTVDRNAVLVRVMGGEVFRIETNSPCLSPGDGAEHLIVGTATGTGLVCKPNDLDLAVGSTSPGGITRRCIVTGVSRLTSGEIAALPPSMRP